MKRQPRLCSCLRGNCNIVNYNLVGLYVSAASLSPMKVPDNHLGDHTKLSKKLKSEANFKK
jgi:hypothetical protein